MARCPILPVGPGVTTTLPVRSDLVQQIRDALAAQGYGVPAQNVYTPELAQQLYGFQRDHPLQVGSDLAVSLGVRGPNGGALGIASCPTYAALGIPCEGVDCVASLWESLVGGYERALALCAALHLLADQGTISLTCPRIPVPTPGGPPAPAPAGTSPMVWLVAGLAAIWLLGRRR